MSKGRVCSDAVYEYTDPHSGRKITRLTDYLGHSNHFYFTDPCWLNGGRSFVFTSQRKNSGDLYRYDLDDHRITQLTDLKSPGRPGGFVSEARGAVYFYRPDGSVNPNHGRTIMEVELDSAKERIVCQIDEAMIAVGRPNVTADGRYISAKIEERMPWHDDPVLVFEGALAALRLIYKDMKKDTVRQILRIDPESGASDLVLEMNQSINHVNASPKLANILTYCHEGPWDSIDQRIWGLDIETGKTWKIREQHCDYSLGHEYWFADGERIGYHGRPRDKSDQHVFGYIRWDNSDRTEVAFPFHSTHFHSLDEQMMVGDGTNAFVENAQPYILLFRRQGDKYIGPKILAYHRSTFNGQYAHCHPRFTPDGKYVLYTSDITSYSNLYLVEVGDFEDLPDLTPDMVAMHQRR